MNADEFAGLIIQCPQCATAIHTASSGRIQYQVIVDGNTPEAFTAKVRSAILDGWKPLGGIGVGDTALYQAMIKYE